MFCPECKDEFRPGFTRCGRCNVDLVEELDIAPRERAPVVQSAPPTRLVDYCGYFTLEEALEARNELRGARIRSEVVIREPAGAGPDAAGRDEFWLRVDVEQWPTAERLLGLGVVDTDSARDGAGGELECGACGERVRADARACPACGVEFEE